MAISPINVTRVSQNLRSSFLVDAFQRNQIELLTAEARIASGRSFVTPSEDPVGASRALNLRQALTQQQQFSRNLQHADQTLAAADSALSEVSSLLIEANAIASENVGSLTSAAEREAVADLIAGIRLQLQTVGNRQFNDRYLFAGRETTALPFVEALGGIAYLGDTGDLTVRASDGLVDAVNVPGNLLFGALSARFGSNVDLTPLLSDTTRLSDLGGAAGAGIRLGTLVFNEPDGAGMFRVDLAGAETIGGVAERINEAAANAGSGLTASVGDAGLILTPGGSPVSVFDTSTGVIAADLGIRTPEAASATIEGADLRPRVTRLTPVADLAGGAGLDLEGGLILTNGPVRAEVDLSEAQTVQDIINTINNAGVYVLARINAEGTGLEVLNQVSGTDLTIAEKGGTTATNLGIRTFTAEVPLADLNNGTGVFTIDGQADFRITAKDGSTIDVNLDGAQTIGDVITLINTAASDAGIAITASLTDQGNGIRLQDGTGGSQSLSVAPLNQSESAYNLGLVQTVDDPATVLVGADVNPVRTPGILDALVQLEVALRQDDTQGIALAAERMERFLKDVTRMHGVVGARSQAMQANLQQMRDATDSAQVFLSEVEDLDYAEAVTRLQAAVTQLQASLQTGSVLLSGSLLDFLQ